MYHMYLDMNVSYGSRYECILCI